MRMRILPLLVVLAGCCVSSIWCELFRSGGGAGEEPRSMNNEVEKDILDKTVDLIQKRAYYYGTSGPGKRLPNYDFGLGKRSKWVRNTLWSIFSANAWCILIPNEWCLCYFHLQTQLQVWTGKASWGVLGGLRELWRRTDSICICRWQSIRQWVEEIYLEKFELI